MNKIDKYIVPIGLFTSVLLLVIATLNYPGGSIHDVNAAGYSWTDNYISNLLSYNALNGMPNSARPFAVAGAVLMGVVTGLAFLRFAYKVNIKQYSVVIKYVSFLLIIFSVLITIPSQHDLMVTLGSISTLIIFVYITILLIKSKLTGLKVISIAFLAFFYGTTYMYFTRTGLDFLPSAQKLIHLLQIIWLLGLEYFTNADDFQAERQRVS